MLNEIVIQQFNEVPLQETTPPASTALSRLPARLENKLIELTGQKSFELGTRGSKRTSAYQQGETIFINQTDCPGETRNSHIFNVRSLILLNGYSTDVEFLRHLRALNPSKLDSFWIANSEGQIQTSSAEMADLYFPGKETLMLVAEKVEASGIVPLGDVHVSLSPPLNCIESYISIAHELGHMYAHMNGGYETSYTPLIDVYYGPIKGVTRDRVLDILIQTYKDNPQPFDNYHHDKLIEEIEAWSFVCAEFERSGLIENHRAELFNSMKESLLSYTYNNTKEAASLIAFSILDIY